MGEQSEQIAVPVNAELKSALGRVGVLFGGQSSEREISLQTGNAVAHALQKAGVEIVAIDLGSNAIDQIRQANLDRAFIALHGPGGEDGRMQALLEFMTIPYTGSGVQASALAMDKLLSKQLWCGIGLPTPPFTVLQKNTDWSATLAELGGEVMVKPAHEGSSIGMARVDSADAMAAAFNHAAGYDATVLAESLIRGAEYTVAIIDGEALPPIKLETDNRFYDYEAKYISEDTRYLCPCGLLESQELELRHLALQAFNSLGCKGWGRVDVMADESGNFYLLEVNTVPGMTSHSLVPMAAKALGMSFEQLVVKILSATLNNSSAVGEG